MNCKVGKLDVCGRPNPITFKDYLICVVIQDLVWERSHICCQKCGESLGEKDELKYHARFTQRRSPTNIIPVVDCFKMQVIRISIQGKLTHHAFTYSC